MKICSKCNNKFPVIILIDDIKRNLNNRKYCLDCSPFKSHNTKKLNNDKKCIICNFDLQGNQTKFCSIKCKQNSTNTNECDTYYYQYLRGVKRKLELIELKGGGCNSCGYKKNISALEFHHLDSKEKEHSLNVRFLSNNKWSNILIEAEKCELLCSNCHKEKHYPENTFEIIKKLKKD